MMDEKAHENKDAPQTKTQTKHPLVNAPGVDEQDISGPLSDESGEDSARTGPGLSRSFASFEQKGGSPPHGHAGQKTKQDELLTLPNKAKQAGDANVEEEQDKSGFRSMSATKIFGRFELLMEVSHGGMATLYLARLRGPEQFEKLLAIKKIHDHLAQEPEFIAMFLDEARIAARIQHPNISTIFDLGKIKDSYFIAMEYVHGQNLRELLREAVRRKETIPWQYAVRVIAEAATGLHAAHELTDVDGTPLNVVHRDVSPQNILVSYEGHVKVVDFGIAYAVQKLGHTTAGTLKGKAAYMSPEQANGDPLDRRSDIFSLGIVLFESVCMKRLFRKSNHSATLDCVRHAKIPRPSAIRPGIPHKLEEIIYKALAKDKADRFATAQELSEHLEELLVSEGKSVTATRLGRLVTDLFHDRRKHKDIQIKRALENKDPEVMRSIGADWSTGTSIEMSSGVTAGSRSASGGFSRWGYLLAGLAVTTLAVGAYLLRDRWLLQSATSPQAPPAPTKTTAQDATTSRKVGPDTTARRPQPRRNVSLRISIDPPEAKPSVLFRGKRYRGNVFEARIPRSDKSETIEISAPGYETRALLVVLNEGHDIPIKLRKVARKTRVHSRRPPVRETRPRKPDPDGLLRELPNE
jgi:serine/threonine-protein kinase